MTTVQVRLEELRAASESLGITATNIRNAVTTAHGLVDGLLAIGFESPAATAFFTNYRRERTIMDEWPNELDSFSMQLETAADALEEAISQEMAAAGVDDGEEVVPPTGGSAGAPPPFIPPASPGGTGTGTGAGTGSGHGSSGGSHGSGSGSSGSAGAGAGTGSGGSSSDEEEAPLPPPPPMDAYVNNRNQLVLDQLNQAQANLETNQTTLGTLEQRRAALVAEYDDLTARMAAAGGGVTPNARMRGLQEQIAALDREIAAATGNVDALNEQINALTERLDRITPGAGADLELISSLEGSQTSQAILNATHNADNSVNCVNYVCNRMPIPPGIPNNAYLWPENAARHPEYGITTGDVPLPGSVLVMQPEHAYGHDVFGHVMYVERVDADGTIWITDNNYHDPIRLQSLTDEIGGPYMTYMYFPWETGA
jgi:surface antigen/cell division protein FtsB/uncharacterized protein YukE